jgi:hypothetical protein
MCLDALEKKCEKAELSVFMVSDLCRLALGEKLDTVEKIKVLAR